MALQFSTTLRNNRANQIASTIGASAYLQLFTGAPPANCAVADSGTLLCEIALPATWMGAAASGAIAKSGTWSGTAQAGGTAGYFRIKDNAKTNTHLQGTVGQGGAAWAPSTAYVLNQLANNNGNVYRVTTAGTSAGSGGPSGTGTSITDGTVVWTYVSAAADLSLNNPVLAQGQTVTINSFGLTEANA